MGRPRQDQGAEMARLRTLMLRPPRQPPPSWPLWPSTMVNCRAYRDAERIGDISGRSVTAFAPREMRSRFGILIVMNGACARSRPLPTVQSRPKTDKNPPSMKRNACCPGGKRPDVPRIEKLRLVHRTAAIFRL